MQVCFTIFHYGLLAKLLAIVSHRSRWFFHHGGASVQAWIGGRKSDCFDEVGMLEDNVRENVAGHPVGQQKLKGFHGAAAQSSLPTDALLPGYRFLNGLWSGADDL